MKIFIDFETASPVKIYDTGAMRYLSDERAQVLCLAVKPFGKRPKIWIPPEIEEMTGVKSEIPTERLKEIIKNAEEIHAYNAFFEILVFDILMGKYGFGPLDINKVFDTMAAASYNGYNGSMAKILKALEINDAKDAEGRKVMLKAQREFFEKPHKFVETFEKLVEYCKHDVVVEEKIHNALKFQMPEKEREQWLLTQKINLSGVRIDLPLINSVKYMINEENEKLLREFKELTGGDFSPTQNVKFLDWLESVGVEIPNLQKATLRELLKSDDLPAIAKRAIEIRLKLSSSSVKKYDAMLNRQVGGIIHENLCYYGANTGRWAGRGIQPQNLPRPSIDDTDSLAIDLINDEINHDPYEIAKSLVRSCLIPRANKKFVCADFASIEGRVLAWLADEFEVLEAYRRGDDLYKIAAAPIFNKKPEEISKDERQIGKIVVLACGYQGSVGAFKAFGKAYGVEMDDDEIREIVYKWRDSRVNTTNLWYDMEKAAKAAVEYKGKAFEINKKIRFKVVKDTLCMKLPSGRMLFYHKPEIIGDKLTFRGINSITKKVGRLETYGGKLVENAVQAISRDLLAEAIVRIKNSGLFDIVLHIHDEILAECNKDISLEYFIELMKEVPKWAQTLPVDADGWEGYRYRK